MVLCLVKVIKVVVELLCALDVIACAVIHEDLKVFHWIIQRVKSIEELCLDDFILQELFNRILTSISILLIDQIITRIERS